MGKKGYALVEAVTAVALVMMASGILSLGISFGLRMERRAEQLKDTDTVQEVPARFRMRTWDGTSWPSGLPAGCPVKQQQP